MPRPTSPSLTERESEIMQILWDSGEATSERIRVQLDGSPHDSSVRTILRVLVAKGYVRANSSVRPTLYKATVRRKRVQAKATKNLLKRFFDGSAEDLVLRLLEDEQLTVEQLDKLKASVTRKGKKK